MLVQEYQEVMLHQLINHFKMMRKSVIIVFFVTVFLNSCEGIECGKLENSYRLTECLLIVSKINNEEFSSYTFNVKGISLTTGKDTLYKEDNRWFGSFYKYINTGDTIIKREGELIFNIHKKDTIMSFNWECEGKVYK